MSRTVTAPLRFRIVMRNEDWQVMHSPTGRLP